MSPTEPQAEKAARILLSRLTATTSGVAEGGGWTPAWSSLVLETTVDEILSAPESRIRDLMRGLWSQLSGSRAKLDPTMSNFLRDIVILTFTRYRQRYEAEDFAWMEASVREGCTEAQGYLALHALPPRWVPAARDAILRALSETAFLDEAQRALEPTEE